MILQKHYKTEGIIVKRKNTGEADRYLTIFTQHFGKIKVKAAGVRKTASRRAPHIELLNLSLVTLYNGRSIPTVVEAQTISNFSGIKSDLTKVGFAYHICELIDGLCPENQENKSIFLLLKQTLKKLCEDSDIVNIVRNFEIDLLTLLGFWPKNLMFKNIDTSRYIEQILERRLRVKNIIPRFT